MAEQPTATTKKKPRSPSYPGIGLEDAIKKAQSLYGEEHRSYAHVDTVIHHWGYKPKSGQGLVVLAALKKFGLVEDEGSGDTRKARITTIGEEFLLLDENEHAARRQALLKQMALSPTIHSELWTRYAGALPSDATLRYELIKEKGFTELAVKEFIPQFRATIAYAQVGSGDKVPDSDTDADNANSKPFGIPLVTQTPGVAPKAPPPSDDKQPKGAGNVRVLNLPLPGDDWAALQVPFPMTEDAWEQMLDVLKVMKRGIVQGPKQSEPVPVESESEDN